MKKYAVVLLICLLACLCFASCSDNAGSVTSGDSQPIGEQSESGEAEDDIPEDSNEEEGEEKPVDDVETKIEAMKEIKNIKELTPYEGNKLKIAFIGDSITQGTGADNQLTESYPAQLQALLDSSKYTVGNFGKASAYTLAANNKYNVKTDASLSYRNTSQYKDSLAFKPDVVVIMMGVNDIRSMSCDEAREELKKALADLVLEYCSLPSVQKVYVSTSIYIPSSATIIQYSDGRLQEVQREVADELGLDTIDMYSLTREYMNVKMHYTKDRIHPVKESYGEMARVYYAALMGEEYVSTVPEMSDSGVVYVKKGGKSTGKGESPQNAINSLAKAIGLLRNNGGTIVICGPYSLEYELHTPHHKGTITITSSYGGVDYAKSAGATLGIAKNLYFNGDYVIENIKMVSELANSIIVCNYNDVKFGDNITSTLASGITTYPLIVAGYNVALVGVPIEDISLHGECNITINSGSWVYFRGGNRRANSSYPNASSDADAVLNLTINGGTFTNASGTNLACGTGMGGFGGTLNFTVNGGVFKGSLYAVGRSGTNTTPTVATMTGTINMKVTGGEFAGSICATQDSTTNVTGQINLTITAALKNKTVGFTNVKVEG